MAALQFNLAWEIPVSRFQLKAQEVHIWLLTQDQPIDIVLSCLKVLEPEEVQRSEQFYFKRDKNRFIVRRALLRNILGKYYLGLSPEKIRFGYGPYGKPHLDGKAIGDDLQFNLSDSCGLVAYAFAKSLKVGIDIEKVRHISDALQIIENTCSEHEKACFMRLSEPDRKEAFFNCWTRKEAYIKAIGLGFSCPLEKFDVSIIPGETPCLLNVSGYPGEAGRWTMISFSPDDSYKAAAVIEGHRHIVRFFGYQNPGVVFEIPGAMLNVDL